MSYEIVSLKDAGTRTGDYIMNLRSKPSGLRRWLGVREESIAFYGNDTRWHAIDGSTIRPHMRKILAHLWHEHQPIERNCHDGALVTTPARVDVVQVASEDSFPASDPPAWTLGR